MNSLSLFNYSIDSSINHALMTDILLNAFLLSVYPYYLHEQDSQPDI